MDTLFIIGLYFITLSFNAKSHNVLFMFIIWTILLYVLKIWAFNKKFTNIFISIIIFIVIIISLTILHFDNKVDNKKTNHITNKKNSVTTNCKANNLETKIDNNIKLKIIDKDNIQKDYTNKQYSLSELDNLSYGYDAKITNKSFYIVHELCEEKQTISFTKLEAVDWTYKKSAGKGSEYNVGDYTQFTNKQADGSNERSIKKPGTYTLYAYVSLDGNKWFIAQKYTFNVK